MNTTCAAFSLESDLPSGDAKARFQVIGSQYLAPGAQRGGPCGGTENRCIYILHVISHEKEWGYNDTANGKYG